MMRLPDFLQHAGLNATRSKMRAHLVDYLGNSTGSKRRIALRDLKALETTGLIIDLDEIKTLRDKTFTFQGERIILYIMQPYQDLPKYHLCNCPTWDKMKATGRKNRYVASKRIDGLFEVDLTSRSGSVRRSIERLDVCQNCLHELGWEGFSFDLEKADRRRIVREFSIGGFFEVKRQSLIREKPQWTTETMPSASYTSDFDAISAEARRASGWRCSDPGCGRLLSRGWQRRFLHTHHRNGVKGDNRRENLCVLCLECHARQPGHERMKNLPEYKRFMQLFGRDVGQ